MRNTQRHREIAHRRAFNCGTYPTPVGAVVNRNFHRQIAGFMVLLPQCFRELQIGEAIRGGGMIEQRPFGGVATVQRLGLDMRYALDRATCGNIYALAVETGHYLKQVLTLLSAPAIKKVMPTISFVVRRGHRCLVKSSDFRRPMTSSMSIANWL
jgi:hypothetical protein